MSIEMGGSSPEPMVLKNKPDELAKYHLTNIEHKFCKPEGGQFNLSEIFPEMDVFTESIKDPDLRSIVESKIDFYKERTGTSGDILTAIGNLIKHYVEGNFAKFPDEIRKSPEFQTLKNKYERLSDAHAVGFADLMAEAMMGVERLQEKRIQEKRDGSVLPKLGARGTFQTPNGAIHGVVEPGAEIGGPYTIKTPQGKVRVSKITETRYN